MSSKSAQAVKNTLSDKVDERNTSARKREGKAASEQEKAVTISPPKIERLAIKIVGNAPYVQNKFSQKARDVIRATQERGSAKGPSKREPKDFQAAYEQALHVSEEGWYGIPAASFRAAMISACRIVGFKMTLAKLSVFVFADGLDADEGTPLVRIYGEPEINESMVRVGMGAADIRWRPMWRKWHAIVRVSYDADQFKTDDVVNLLMRAGMQVGIGEGRPDSKSSAGMGWGTFDVELPD